MQTINRFILLKTFVSTQNIRLYAKTFDSTQKNSIRRKNIRFYAKTFVSTQTHSIIRKTFDSTQNIRFYAKTFDSTQKNSIRRKWLRLLFRLLHLCSKIHQIQWNPLECLACIEYWKDLDFELSFLFAFLFA